MKIALPYNTQLGEYQTNVVKGGIEKFCHQIVNTFDVEIINIDNNDPIKENVRKTKEEYTLYFCCGKKHVFE